MIIPKNKLLPSKDTSKASNTISAHRCRVLFNKKESNNKKRSMSLPRIKVPDNNFFKSYKEINNNDQIVIVD